MKIIRIALLLLLTTTTLAQISRPPTKPAPTQKPAKEATELDIPIRTIEFKPGDSPAGLSISWMIVIPNQCTSDGSLFLHSMEPKDYRQSTLTSIKGNKSQTYSPTAITDVHDLQFIDFFPSDSIVGLLVFGTKESPAASGPGKLPARIAWKDYHYYIAEFDRDGSYKQSVELPMTYPPTHIAVLSSGEFLVSGYDAVNSTPRLLFLDSSGQVLRALDLPAARRATERGAYGSPESMTASSELIGGVYFTAYKDHILAWHRESADPILDVGPGASVREVPLHVPRGFVFTELLPSNDRWVAKFRSKATPNNSGNTPVVSAYYELRPEDASLSAKLIQTGTQVNISCESDSTYIAHDIDKDGKLILMKAN